MPKLKSLSTLLTTAIKTTTAAATTTTTTTTTTATDKTLKHFVTNLDPKTRPKKSRKAKLPFKPKRQPQCLPPPSPVVNSNLHALSLEEGSDSEDSATNPTTQDIANIINDGVKINSLDTEEANDEEVVEKVLEIPWFLNLRNNNISIRRKEVSRERKQKWVFKYSQFNRFDRLVDTCGYRLGSDATRQVFGKLGRETGLKEFNSLIKMSVDQAKETDDVNVVMEQINYVLDIFVLMKEQGFPIEEETYGPFLMLLVDNGMVEELHFFSDIIRDTNPSKNARLGYYEMLLYIRVNDEEKVQELCNYISTADGDETIDLRENYLLALCESDRKDDLLLLLGTIDITKLSSLDHVASVFRSFGRLSLESSAEKFLSVFKNCDYEAEFISTLILSYVTSIPNLAVEDVVSKFKTMHTMMEISSSMSYEKLILYCCNILKVHDALDIADQMCGEGLTLSIGTIHSILNASEESHDFNLVWRIYSLICHQNSKPNNETFRRMISLCVKMKDFDGAYGLLNDLKKLNLTPTSSMYNAIMGGYFREKNTSGALMVLKQMELADVKPDSSTYSYLIGNCNSEEKIIKFYEEMKVAGIQVSKQIYMSLINAYATCGQFEKAKQVLLDKEIPVKNLNEIKSVLVSALASHGQMSDALDIYEEIKEAGFNLEPKAVISLIEHTGSRGELSILLKLLEELHDRTYWMDGCSRVILYCIHHKHLRSAVDLLKQLKDRFSNDELVMEALFEQVFSTVAELEPTDLQIGLDLLQAIKDELGVSPSRKCLDFLLSACAKAKDLRNSLLIWKEYQAAGLPYNVASYLRMYQALLACGSHVSAKVMLDKIPKDDVHVRIIIERCQKIYTGSSSSNGKKKTDKDKVKG